MRRHSNLLSGSTHLQLGERLPSIATPLPGPRSAALIDTLAKTECPAFTTRRARRSEQTGAPHDPIVWAEAVGSNVVDADGNVFVDLTGGFGVATIGHRHPHVVQAIQAQSERVLHALGDLHPSDVKITLLQRLAELAPFDGARVVLSLSGADAVETALKSAMLHTGRPGVIAFDVGYHGLSHGPLAVTGFSPDFRAPFADQLNPHVTFVPFPAPGASLDDALAQVDQAWPTHPVGAVIAEPIIGRGGVRIPPRGFLAAVADRARGEGAVVIADEILCGLGRTGAMFRSVYDSFEPDLICIGKSLGGGLPVSACLGRPEVMASWGSPDGAAIHTGTFFGHPLGCAAALATLEILEAQQLAARARVEGERLMEQLRTLDHPAIVETRGAGLLIGTQVSKGTALVIVQRLLERGYLALPAGPAADVVQIAPPLTVARPLLQGFVDAFRDCLSEIS